MSPLAEIEAAGVTLSMEGQFIRARPASAITPAIRGLIRAHRPWLVAALQPVDLSDLHPAGLPADATTVMCSDCRHCTGRPGARPD